MPQANEKKVFSQNPALSQYSTPHCPTMPIHPSMDKRERERERERDRERWKMEREIYRRRGRGKEGETVRE